MFDSFTVKTEDTLKKLVWESNQEFKTITDVLSNEIVELKKSIKSNDKMNDKSERDALVLDAYKLVKAWKSPDLITAIDVLWENTTGKGKELVIKEFALEIIQRMAEFSKVEVKQYFTQTDNKTVRKYKNGTQTQYVAVWTAPTFSEWDTESLLLTVADAVTAVKVEDNLLEDEAMTYTMLVKDIVESQSKFRETQVFLWDGSGLNRTWVLENANIIEVDSPKTSLAWLTAVELDDLLDEMVTTLDASLDNGAKWYVSKYELSILKKARDTNGNKLYPELELKDKVLKGYSLVVVDNKIIKNSTLDITAKRWILLANFTEWYAELFRTQFNIETMYINDDQAKRVKTVFWKSRNTWAVIEAEAFIVSKNA